MDFEAIDKISLAAVYNTDGSHVTMSQVEIDPIHAQGVDYRVVVHMTPDGNNDLGIDVTGVAPTAANFILA